MPDEPGFELRVTVAGSTLSVKTTAAAARKNVIESSLRPRTSLARALNEADLQDRGALHYCMSVVAADVLLAGDVEHRFMQDADGQWWAFRRGLVGAIQVIDEAADRRAAPIGFGLPPAV